MLIGNAQNLMQSIKETIKAVETASEKLYFVVDDVHLCWTKRTR